MQQVTTTKQAAPELAAGGIHDGLEHAGCYQLQTFLVVRILI